MGDERTERWVDALEMANTNRGIFTADPQMAAEVLMRLADEEASRKVAAALEPFREAQRLVRIARRGLHMALDRMGDTHDPAAPTPENVDRVAKVMAVAYVDALSEDDVSDADDYWQHLIDPVEKQAWHEAAFAGMTAVRR